MSKDNSNERLPNPNEIATLAYDDSAGDKNGLWELRWEKWVSLTKLSVADVATNVSNKLADITKKSNIINQEKTSLHNKLETLKLEDTEKSKKLDHNLVITKNKLENITSHSENLSPISMRWYYATVTVFGGIEAPLNYLAFQENSPNLLALAVLVAALGVVLGLGAHFVGSGLKQFPRQKGNKAGKFGTLCWISFWLLSIIALYFGINYFRDSSGSVSGGGMFWLIMLVNILLFSAVTFFAYRVHDCDAKRHEKRVQINSLKSDIHEIEEDQIEEDDDTEEDLQAQRSTIQDQINAANLRLVNLKDEYASVIDNGIASQNTAIARLEAAIATYKHEYAKIADEPAWEQFSSADIKITLESKPMEQSSDAVSS